MSLNAGSREEMPQKREKRLPGASRKRFDRDSNRPKPKPRNCPGKTRLGEVREF